MYERFYRLRERPFALTPDPDYLYPSKMHSEALGYLRYGIETHAGFVVITGAMLVMSSPRRKRRSPEVPSRRMANARKTAKAARAVARRGNQRDLVAPSSIDASSIVAEMSVIPLPTSPVPRGLTPGRAGR